MAEDPLWRDLAVMTDGDDDYSRYYQIPCNADDLLIRSKLIEAATTEGRTIVVLVKEIGSDALFSLHRVATRLDRERGTARQRAALLNLISDLVVRGSRRLPRSTGCPR